jgi:hypothetical protein
MLTRNQLRVLFPQLGGNSFKTVPKKCLFGSPDPVETRILLEEQFLMDREYVLQRYSFDIATDSPVISIYAAEKEKAETEAAVTGSHGMQNSFLLPAPTSEEVGKQCSPESEVRRRSGRCSPYNRQMKITGKSKARVTKYGRTCRGSKVFE